MPAKDLLFEDMSRPEHAYALGVVAARGRIKDDVLKLRLKGDGEPILSLLLATRKEGGAQFEQKDGEIRIFASLEQAAARFLGSAPGDKVNLRFPNLRASLALYFVRGIFDSSMQLSSFQREAPVLKLERMPEKLLEGVVEFLGVAPDKRGRRFITWKGVNALDVLGIIYEGLGPQDLAEVAALLPGSRARASFLFREKNLRRYLGFAHQVLGLNTSSYGQIRVQKIHPDAQLPSKSRVSDSGYDLTILYEKKRFGKTVLYGTGLIVEPPFGWYFDVVPRSSIIKQGYLLANNVGVIDRAYRGELLIPLVKIDPDAPELSLPTRIAQLIPRPIVHLPLISVDVLDETHRGEGGFGSSDAK